MPQQRSDTPPQRATADSAAHQNTPPQPRIFRLLAVFVLGVIGWAVAWIVRNPADATSCRSGSRKGRRRSEADAALPEDVPSQPASEEAVPAQTSESWIAGPLGNLRLLEVHPDAALTVVFLHGLGGRAEHWSGLLSSVGPGIHGVALDLPGHGESEFEATSTEFTLETMAKAVQAVLQTLKIRRAVVVGHDLGAAVAMQLAAKTPSRVSGLFLLDPNGDQSRLGKKEHQQILDALAQDPLDEVKWQFKQILGGAKPEIAAQVLNDLAASQPQALLASVRSSLKFEPPKALAAFDGPCQILVSELNDLPYSLHRVMPDLPFSVFGGVSHWLMLDDPKAVWGAIVEFLGELRATDRL